MATAAAALPSVCSCNSPRSNAYQRTHASGATSTSDGFSYAHPIPQQRSGQPDLKQRRKLFTIRRLHTLSGLDHLRSDNFSKSEGGNQGRQRAVNVRAARGGVLDKPGSGGGAGVLEKPPALDTSWLEKLYQTESGGEGSKEKDIKRTGGGDQYRVLLVDSPKHNEKKVASVLPKVVPNVSSEAARGIYAESKVKGVGIVVVCVKEYAETYCQLLIRNGLSSKIEPDQDTL